MGQLVSHCVKKQKAFHKQETFGRYLTSLTSFHQYQCEILGKLKLSSTCLNTALITMADLQPSFRIKLVFVYLYCYPSLDLSYR